MRVERPGGAGAIAGPRTVRRSSGENFALESEGAHAPAASTGARALGGIDLLIALQGIEEPGERRRRAVVRGRGALDALDELKIGLLAGGLSDSTLARLKAAVTGLTDGSGDTALDGVLAEIELRVEVELAKIAPVAARRQALSAG